MTLEGAIKKVENVAHGNWKFNEHDYQDLIRFLKELKAKRDEEHKALIEGLRRNKKFTFDYHWSKGNVLSSIYRTYYSRCRQPVC